MKRLALLYFLFSIPLMAQTGNDELVEVRELIPDVRLDLRYATADNFTHQKLFSTNVCYLSLGAVKGLMAVQDSLRRAGLSLMIFDGYRPRAIQYLMFEILPNPVYVADPASGSKHNRGSAVDLTIVDASTGAAWDMGTDFDFFGNEAAHSYTNLSAKVLQNRQYFKSVMVNIGGFAAYDAEWWHYDYPAGASYPLLDFQMK